MTESSAEAQPQQQQPAEEVESQQAAQAVDSKAEAADEAIGHPAEQAAAGPGTDEISVGVGDLALATESDNQQSSAATDSNAEAESPSADGASAPAASSDATTVDPTTDSSGRPAKFDKQLVKRFGPSGYQNNQSPGSFSNNVKLHPQQQQQQFQQRSSGNWRGGDAANYGGDGGYYGKQQQQNQQNARQSQYASNGYGGAGARYQRNAQQQPGGSVYGYSQSLAYQNGQSATAAAAAAATAAYYQRGPQQQQQAIANHQGGPASAAASGDSDGMLILQQQSYVPQEQVGGDRSGLHHHPGLTGPHGGHVGPSPGRSQFHPNVPAKAILYGSYVDPNMIQPSGSSRNTSPGNGDNDRKSNTNLYIRGLLPTDTDETIRQLVSENANIPNDAINSTKAVLDEQTGQCKGYGFVDFRDETQAQLALDALTKTSLRNGKLQISYARAKEESEKDPTNIYIKNLPIRTECNEEWMSRVFTDELGGALTGRIISCRVMRATDPSTRQQTSATGAGFIRFEKDQDAVNAITHINKNGATLGQKYGCPRPLEAKLADKTNQRKKQRAQQQQQPGLAAHHGLGPSPPGAGQLPLGIFQQNPAALAAARGAVLPASYSAPLLPGGAAQLYSQAAAVQSSALTGYTSRGVTSAGAPPSAPAHTSYVFQASPASAMTGAAGGAPSIYQQQQRSSWFIDPSSYAAAAAAAGMSGMYAAAAPQLLAPQSTLYAQDASGALYYPAGLDPTANAYHPMGLTAADQQ